MEMNDDLKFSFGDLVPGDVFTFARPPFRKEKEKDTFYDTLYMVIDFYGEFMENAVNLEDGSGFAFDENDAICFKGNFSKVFKKQLTIK